MDVGRAIIVIVMMAVFVVAMNIISVSMRVVMRPCCLHPMKDPILLSSDPIW